MLRPTAALFLLTGLLAGCGLQTTTIAGSGTQPSASVRGIVDDWSTHHVHFSNPGTEANAIRNGTYDRWLSIVNNPRYQTQQLRRNPPQLFRKASAFMLSGNPMHRDWASQIAPPTFGGAARSFPAEYGVNADSTPSCSDFIVYPANASGSATQANIVGFNNLYDGSCPSSAGSGQPFAPTVQFAYFVDSGAVQSSPVLSMDGTKIAFVAISSAGTNVHIVTLGTTGDNGAAYNSAVTPCTVNGVQNCATNNAVDLSIHISAASGVAYPFSSPFIDYSNDMAYVGDGAGVLHKITGVFLGVPAEVTTNGWPMNVSPSFPLASPVYDAVSHHMFVTSGQGLLWCIDISSASPAFCDTPDIVIGDPASQVYDGPIVDGTAGTVFAEGVSTNLTATLTQATTSLGNVVQASMGSGFAKLFSGDFDNNYYNGNYASGFMYFCGTAASTSYAPTLYRIGFNSNGTMNGANDGNSFALTASGGSSCTPLTEAYNPSQGEDYLFLGVDGWGAPVGCNGEACLMSFELGPSFPSAPAATLPLGGNAFFSISGIVIDNESTAPGASQIYFSNTITGNATQASQNGLN